MRNYMTKSCKLSLTLTQTMFQENGAHCAVATQFLDQSRPTLTVLPISRRPLSSLVRIFLILSLNILFVSSKANVLPGTFNQINFEDDHHKLRSTMDEDQTDSPVIGILTQVLRDYKRFANEPKLHLVSSYVKWLESSGARIIPILIDQDDEYYERMFNQTNGLVFPGGDNIVDPHKATPMMVAAKKLYQLAVEAKNAGKIYPVWGTCLGFELLATLGADSNDVLVNCSANDIVLNVELTSRGRLLASPPSDGGDRFFNKNYVDNIVNVLEQGTNTYHYHHKCVTDESFLAHGLDKMYNVLGHSVDHKGLRFISMFEAKEYPFYGVIFHPEKPPYEFRKLSGQKNVPHNWDSIQLSRYFADYIVRLARKNSHDTSTIDPNDRQELIYNYNTTYTGLLANDMYESRYLMPWTPKQSTTTIELSRKNYSPNDDATEDAPDDGEVIETELDEWVQINGIAY
ncbi:Gamma-glutamyl hydrolase [Fragariocoptes setiger]|uniref:folate gamma-glutamyl hydrolase n=1 Tax=Fragariocoptes setiger TaxID=1670756 RepID=A0ABQ7SBG3_9ACAR|nr:Gamma-glutamyl hydrolase [Fragariocoptes setiger]